MADSSVFERRVYNAGDVIIAKGDPATHMFLIERGQVEVWDTDDSKQKKVFVTLGAGRIFGELALIDRAPRMATVTALESTVVLCLPEVKLQETLAKCPPFITSLIKMLVENVRQK